MGILYLPTIGIIVSMVPRVMHAIIGIRAYQFRYNKGKLSQKMEMELLFPPEGEKESLAVYVVAWSSPPLSVEASMSADSVEGSPRRSLSLSEVPCEARSCEGSSFFTPGTLLWLCHTNYH